MACPLHAEDAFEPGDDFVGGGVGGFVEVDDAGGDVGFQVAAEGRAAGGDGGEVAGADEYCALLVHYSVWEDGILTLVPIPQQQWPGACIDRWSDRLGLDDHVLPFVLLHQSHLVLRARVEWGKLSRVRSMRQRETIA